MTAQEEARITAARQTIRGHAEQLARIVEAEPVDTDAPATVLALETLAQCVAAIAALDDDGGETAERLIALSG